MTMNSASDRSGQRPADDRRGMKDQYRRLAAWLVAVPLVGLAAAGCGGGGGGGGPTTSTAWYEVSVSGVGSTSSSAFEGGNIVLKGNDGVPYTVPAVAGAGAGLQVTSAGGVAATLVIDRNPVNRICSISAAPTALGGRGSASLSCVHTPINDTGLTECMPGVDCALQDGGTGRGAIPAKLGKLNPSSPGSFDYTRICNNGLEEGAAGCPSGTPVGAGASQWGCTRDNVTGLVWRVVDYPGRYTQGDAVAIPVEGWCGRAASSWRLPSVDQLQSVFFNAGTVEGADRVAALTSWLPMLNFNRRNALENPIPSSISSEGSGFWSSTLVATATGEAWMALLQGNGRVRSEASNTLRLRVAPVSTADLSSRFADSYYSAARWEANLSAGTLLDRRSGLMWMICSAGWSFNATAGRCDPVAGQPAVRAFRDALAESAAVNQDASRNRGYSDWRVPNRAELASLVDCVRWRPAEGGSAGCTDAALKKLVDLDLTGAGSFWTSSWVPGNEVFTIDFSTGAIGLSPIIGLDPLDPAAPTTFRARLVRNAR
jgi:hypothetical protein